MFVFSSVPRDFDKVLLRLPSMPRHSFPDILSSYGAIVIEHCENGMSFLQNTEVVLRDSSFRCFKDWE
jgi:hypothetical protein